MSLRRLAKLTRVGTKAGLAGGTMYIYYEAGLWKGSDETIKNFEKFKKDSQALYESTPVDFQKWMEYANSTVSTNVQPYTKSVSDFRKEWLNFDLSFLTESGDGFLKPTWNRGVSWTVETLKDSPNTLQRWGKTGYQKINEMIETTETNESAGTPAKQ